MTLDTRNLRDRIVSHAMRTGLFERVNQHEPKNAPGLGRTCSITFRSIGPARGQSGLATTTALVVFMVRIQTPMLQEPQDDIDGVLMEAVDVLMQSYSVDFDLEGTIRSVDLLGLSGTPLAARAGYINHDGKMFRTVDIDLPLIVNDVWDQE